MANQLAARTIVYQKASFPVFGLLGIILILLKVFEVGVVATWSWWLVTLPLWIGFAMVLFVFAAGFAIMAGAVIFGGIYIIVSGLIEARRSRKRLEAVRNQIKSRTL